MILVVRSKSSSPGNIFCTGGIRRANSTRSQNSASMSSFVGCTLDTAVCRRRRDGRGCRVGRDCRGCGAVRPPTAWSGPRGSCRSTSPAPHPTSEFREIQAGQADRSRTDRLPPIPARRRRTRPPRLRLPRAILGGAATVTVTGMFLAAPRARIAAISAAAGRALRGRRSRDACQPRIGSRTCCGPTGSRSSASDSAPNPPRSPRSSGRGRRRLPRPLPTRVARRHVPLAVVDAAVCGGVFLAGSAVSPCCFGRGCRRFRRFQQIERLLEVEPLVEEVRRFLRRLWRRRNTAFWFGQWWRRRRTRSSHCCYRRRRWEAAEAARAAHRARRPTRPSRPFEARLPADGDGMHASGLLG